MQICLYVFSVLLGHTYEASSAIRNGEFRKSSQLECNKSRNVTVASSVSRNVESRNFLEQDHEGHDVSGQNGKAPSRLSHTVETQSVVPSHARLSIQKENVETQDVKVPNHARLNVERRSLETHKVKAPSDARLNVETPSTNALNRVRRDVENQDVLEPVHERHDEKGRNVTIVVLLPITVDHDSTDIKTYGPDFEGGNLLGAIRKSQVLHTLFDIERDSLQLI